QLQTRKWTDQSGVEKYNTEVVLQRFRGELTILDSRGGGSAESEDSESFGQSSPLASPLASPNERRPAPAGASRYSGIDDEIPF
ncbi:MAG: single-stranded DNA-binding protein, partial [Microvirga sp.]